MRQGYRCGECGEVSLSLRMCPYCRVAMQEIPRAEVEGLLRQSGLYQLLKCIKIATTATVKVE